MSSGAELATWLRREQPVKGRGTLTAVFELACARRLGVSGRRRRREGTCPAAELWRLKIRGAAWQPADHSAAGAPGEEGGPRGLRICGAPGSAAAAGNGQEPKFANGCIRVISATGVGKHIGPSQNTIFTTARGFRKARGPRDLGQPTRPATRSTHLSEPGHCPTRRSAGVTPSSKRFEHCRTAANFRCM